MDPVPAGVLDWLPADRWQDRSSLARVPGFAGLTQEILGLPKRWKDWAEAPRAEEAPLPGDWKRATPLERLLIARALRPTRLVPAVALFVRDTLGAEYAQSRPWDLSLAVQQCGPSNPILIFLSPGLDVSSAVEAQAREAAVSGPIATVSLGQGQERAAMSTVEQAHAAGGWVLLQNIHLSLEWTSGPLTEFVTRLSRGGGGEVNTAGPHPDFRLFLSAEPPPALEKPLPAPLLLVRDYSSRGDVSYQLDL